MGGVSNHEIACIIWRHYFTQFCLQFSTMLFLVQQHSFLHVASECFIWAINHVRDHRNSEAMVET